MASPYITPVSTFSDSGVEQADIDRRRKMAEMLMQQGSEPLQTNQMAGGYVVPVSPWAGLAKVLQSGLGAYQSKQQDERQKALAERVRGDQSTDASSLAAYLRGTPGTPETMDENMITTPATPGTAPMSGEMPNFRTPEYRQLLSQMLIKQAEKGMDSPFAKIAPEKFTPESLAKYSATRNPSDLVPVREKKPVETVDANGNPVTGFVDTFNPPTTPVPKPVRNEIAPNGQVINPFTTQPGTILPDPNKPFATPPGGGAPVPNTPYQDYELKKATASRPSMTSTVINSGPKAFEQELGKLDAEQIGKWRDAALAGQQTLQIADNLRTAEANGTFSGGGAQIKTAVANLVNGITGATPKNLVGSQEFNAEASKLVLEKIKTLGTNPSNADRDFIEKTVPQLSQSPQARAQLIAWMEGKANQAIDLAQRAEAHARKNHGLSGFNPIERRSGSSVIDAADKILSGK